MEDADELDSDDEWLLREAARAPFREPLPRLKPGSRVGKYLVGELLGRGAMGVVYAAIDPQLDRKVALKVMPIETLGPERRARFVRETRAAVAASGPNIATVYDSGEADDLVYCAMELVDGPTLRAWMRTSRTLDEIVRIAAGIARGLARAHAVGVVHRDLKPDNVMLDATGEPRVLDFGLAKRVELAGGHDDDLTELQTREGYLLGTPAYMSPEQAKGLDVDAQSDVFSFGAMLYEMLTGKRPFAGKTTIEMLIAIDRDVHAPPSSINPDVGPALDALVGRCLAKTAAERPSSEEIAAELARYERRGDVARPRRRWPIVAGAAVIVGAAIAAWLLWPRSPMALTDVREAQLAYDEGVATLAAGGDAISAFERAVALDPDFAAAHLHLARIRLFSQPDRAVVPPEAHRDHLRKALANEARLPPALRGMAHALEPIWLRDPYDVPLAIARFEQLAREFPDDELVARMRAFVIAWWEVDKQLPELERLQAEFPTPGNVATYAQFLATSGRVDEARPIAEACVLKWPRTRPCLHTRLLIARIDGDCARMETLARQFIINAPESPDGYIWLASSLAGRQPTAAVRTALEGRYPLIPVDQLAATREADASDLAVLDGDLDGGLAHANAAIADVASSRWQMTHAIATLRAIRILRELGREDEAHTLASTFAAQGNGWELDDSSPYVFALHRYADPAWAPPKPDGNDPPNEWFAQVGYPAYVEGSAEAARIAIADPRARNRYDASHVIGVLHHRAGDPTGALALLDSGTRQCRLADQPIEMIQAFDELGRVREELGDVRGACAAYQRVSTRWPKPSRTADHARTRGIALGCTK